MKDKHFVYLTKEIEKEIPNSLKKLTYKGKGFGFEVEEYFVEFPFLRMTFQKKERLFSLSIPTNWVQYIASATGRKSLGFLFENRPEN